MFSTISIGKAQSLHCACACEHTSRLHLAVAGPEYPPALLTLQALFSGPQLRLLSLQEWCHHSSAQQVSCLLPQTCPCTNFL